MEDTEHTRWLKRQCQRYIGDRDMDGKCWKQSCLRRGAKTEEWVDLREGDIATCEPHEILKLLKDYQNLMKTLLGVSE